MGKVQRGAVPVPNEQMKGNHVNSSSPLGRHAPATKAPNAGIHNGDINNGFLPMAKHASQCSPPNNSTRFDVNDARDGYDNPPVASPGRGAIPVNPFMDNGNPNRASVPLYDDAFMKKGK